MVATRRVHARLVRIFTHVAGGIYLGTTVTDMCVCILAVMLYWMAIIMGAQISVSEALCSYQTLV